MVLVTFFMYEDASLQLLPQMIFTALYLASFVIVRPYVSMFVNLCYITLTALYFAMILQVYILVHSSKKDKADKQSQLNNMLIAFFILKNIVIVIDVLLSFQAVWRMIERIQQLAKFKRGGAVLMDSKTRADSIDIRSSSGTMMGGDEFQSEVRDPSDGSISFKQSRNQTERPENARA